MFLIVVWKFWVLQVSESLHHDDSHFQRSFGHGAGLGCQWMVLFDSLLDQLVGCLVHDNVLSIFGFDAVSS